ncbi:MAG: hypothetical protein IPH58_05650 [Sphingobacteriales bacterium]|jgi:hypothetical protein|nr:hypothetical protein [Sphingobacteriales bacterium]
MATLTLTLNEKAELLNSIKFQNRINMAAAKTAKYWLDYATDTIAKYNVAVKKRKIFARQIIKQGITQEYIKQFLLKYNPSEPILENDGHPFDAECNQLVDSVLTDSSASAEVFDLMAGVVVGDDMKAVEL